MAPLSLGQSIQKIRTGVDADAAVTTAQAQTTTMLTTSTTTATTATTSTTPTTITTTSSKTKGTKKNGH